MLKSARHYHQSGIYSHLMCDIGSCITNVSAHFAHHANMFVAVQQRILLFFARFSAMGSFVCFKACIGQHDNQPFRVFVIHRDRDVLFSDKTRKFGWGERLRSRTLSFDTRCDGFGHRDCEVVG